MALKEPMTACRKEKFSTCPEDRPVLAQFCSNDPQHLLAAAQIIAQEGVDGVDINLGCPQRIAKRGRYGAFLMDDLPLVERLVSTLAKVFHLLSPPPHDRHHRMLLPDPHGLWP